MDFFQSLFSRDAQEETGLTISPSSNPKPKKNAQLKAQPIKPNKPNIINNDLYDVVLPLKNKRTEDDEYLAAEQPKKKRASKNEGLADNEALAENKVVAEGLKAEEEKVEVAVKKKKKRDELETKYEVKTYGVGKKDGEEVVVVKKRVGEKRKKMEDAADMSVGKDDGFDDESKLLRTVFIGNLPLKMKKKVLFKEFSKFGEVESLRIRSVPLVNSKTPRKGAIHKGEINEAVDSVHAYIVFKDEQSAKASLSYNMAVVGGNHIRVDVARPPRKKLKGDDTFIYDNKRTVFVGNLPFDVKDEEIYRLFCGIAQFQNSIEAVRVIRDHTTSVGKGIAYVMFKSREAANLVIRKHLKIRDRELRLSYTRPESTPSKTRVSSAPSNKRSSLYSSTDNLRAKKYAASPNADSTTSNKSRIPSFQGLRANKSDDKKKESSHPKTTKFCPRTFEQEKQISNTKSEVSGKERKNKRPAVAARKAKAKAKAKAFGGGNGNGNGGTLKQTKKKRKVESGTPVSSDRAKKVRKMK